MCVVRRPQCGDIAKLRGIFTHQIVACTATADEPTRKQIITLQMKEPEVVSMVVRHQNMSRFVTMKHPRACEVDLVYVLRCSSAAKVEVFCCMRNEADRVYKLLIGNGMGME
jgi:superfamily II DNA helicase RecQ